jgi:integrase/recombinase XerD
MRRVQNMLGRNSSKTSKIYTKIIEVNSKNTGRPLDLILKNRNFKHRKPDKLFAQ